MVRNLAIIPARSGSKRVKDKNIRPFAGRPLMEWVIDAARDSGVFERVYVSTDSDRYADIARSCGAWVPFLRDGLMDDRSPLAEVACHELLRVERETGMRFDSVAILQPTCPLLRPEDVRTVYEGFVSAKADSAMSCFPFDHCNPWWAFRLSDSGTADYVFDSPWDSRSQDRGTLYCPTGALGIAHSEMFKTDPVGVMRRCVFMPIPWESGFDIDSESDFVTAEALFAMRKGRNV